MGFLSIHLESDIPALEFLLLQLRACTWERKYYKVIEAQQTKDARNKIRDRDKKTTEAAVTRFAN